MNVTEKHFDIEEFLSGPLMATLTTASECGPRETPVWFLWEDNALWIIASTESTFLKRLRHESRCAIGIVDFDLARGFMQHLGLHGIAPVMPMETSRRSRLIQRYLGAEYAWNPGSGMP